MHSTQTHTRTAHTDSQKVTHRIIIMYTHAYKKLLEYVSFLVLYKMQHVAI